MLGKEFNIVFTSLMAITNIPINRFAHSLRRDGQLETYQQLLVDNFNPATVEGLMCRHTINLDWEGRVFDCDFNQMLDMPMAGAINKTQQNAQPYLWDLQASNVADKTIALDRHCFGCTAGAGSSCGGSLA